MEIKGTTITIMCSDIKTTIDFYTKVVGFKLIKNYGGHYAEVESGGLKIGINPTDRKINIGNNMSIGLGVTDFDKETKRLTKAGVKVKISQDGPIRLASFQDPDGNPLYLAELKS